MPTETSIWVPPILTAQHLVEGGEPEELERTVHGSDGPAQLLLALVHGHCQEGPRAVVIAEGLQAAEPYPEAARPQDRSTDKILMSVGNTIFGCCSHFGIPVL